MAKMLFEIKFHYDDGTVSHDLIECENPTKWEGDTVLTNMAKRAKFETTAFIKRKILKIEKKCVLACKTKNFKQHGWCSGDGYVWPSEWWKM
jgi:hypothetical protein